MDHDEGPSNGAPVTGGEVGSPGEQRYNLRLYVTGLTGRSTRAVANVRAICEQHLRGRYDLQVIDLYQRPALAARDQIVAAPTLVKELPPPLRRVIGDMSNRERVIAGLGLGPRT